MRNPQVAGQLVHVHGAKPSHGSAHVADEHAAKQSLQSTHTPEQMDNGSSQDCCTSKRWMNIGKVVLGLAIIILLFWLTFDQNSSLNIWQNTKSMHAADSTGSLAWVALLPGQVYMERGEKFLEYNVQADHDNDWKHEAYHRKLLLAGGANILTNISSNVYVTTILFIYLLSLIDVKDNLIKILAQRMSGETADISRNELTSVRLIFWGSWVIFVLVYLLRNYSVWHEVTWKAQPAPEGVKDVTIKYQWEFGGSAFYAMAVVAMYIWCIDYRSYHLIHPKAEKFASGFFLASHDDKYHHEDKIKTVFTVCFFLLVMALLGQSRDIILETETQVCLLSTVAFCFLMILTTRVQRFFMFVESSLIARLSIDKTRLSMVTHVQMTRSALSSKSCSLP